MVDMNQFRIEWTGAAGLPGVSTFYNVGTPQDFISKAKTFFEAVKAFIPNDVTITFPSTGNVVNVESGNVVATWLAGQADPTLGAGSGTYAAPVGAVINWNTSLYVAGRRLRGKTFLVPCVGGVYDSAGRITTANMPILRNAANALTGGSSPMCIYSPSHRVQADVTTATVPQMAAVLRSRRD